MAYSDKVVDHYNNPRNVGSFDKSDPAVGTGIVGAPECGDVMKLQLKVRDGVVEDAKFKTFGCGSAIASSSLATEWLKGKTLDQAMSIRNTQIVEELSLPPVKIHCSVLAEDAIKTAVTDYKLKAGILTGEDAIVQKLIAPEAAIKGGYVKLEVALGKGLITEEAAVQAGLKTAEPAGVRS